MSSSLIQIPRILLQEIPRPAFLTQAAGLPESGGWYELSGTICANAIGRANLQAEDFELFDLTSLLPGTGFDVHLNKMPE